MRLRIGSQKASNPGHFGMIEHESCFHSDFRKLVGVQMQFSPQREKERKKVKEKAAIC